MQVRVSKWGQSLAVRLPAEIVKKLRLRPGSNIEITVTRPSRRTTKRQRKDAVERLSKLRVKFPEGYVFDREEAHERGKS
jgi:antitoxin MazE